VVALVVALSLQIAGADLGPCVNPRAAAATILSNLRDDRMDPSRAARCAEATPTLSRVQREQAMTTLKSALDAVGARVRIEDIPETAAHIDARTFEPIVVLARELPRVRLERMDDGQWMLPSTVLVNADAIYDDAVALDLHRAQRSFPAWAQQRVLGVAVWQMLALLALFALGVAVRWIVAHGLTWKSDAILGAFKLTTPKEDVLRATRPLGTIVLCLVVILGVPSLALSGGASTFVIIAMRVVAAFMALRFSWVVVDVAADQMVRRAQITPGRMDDHIVPLIRRMLKIAVIAMAGALVLQTFGVNVGSLVAGLGIGGLAVALAAKDTIGNFFGSVAIFLDRPFQLGDWITAGDVEGTVEHVGFRSTQIRTVRDTVVTVPNAKLADTNLDNYGARRARQLRMHISVEHGATPEQIEAFCDGIRAIIAAHPHTKKEEIEAHLHDVTQGALTFIMQLYIVRPTWGGELRTRHELLVDIVRLANDIGLRIAYPTRTLRMTDANADRSDASNVPDVDALRELIKSYGPGGAKAQAPGPRILPAPPSEPVPAPQSESSPPRTP
jgi:MscS family membrane protein